MAEETPAPAVDESTAAQPGQASEPAAADSQPPAAPADAAPPASEPAAVEPEDAPAPAPTVESLAEEVAELRATVDLLVQRLTTLEVKHRRLHL